MFSYSPGYVIEGCIDEDERWGRDSHLESKNRHWDSFAFDLHSKESCSSSSSSSSSSSTSTATSPSSSSSSSRKPSAASPSSSSSRLASSTSAFTISTTSNKITGGGLPGRDACPFQPPNRSPLAQLNPEEQQYQISHFYRRYFLHNVHKNYLVYVRGGGVMVVSMLYHDQSHFHLIVRYKARLSPQLGGVDFCTVDKQQLSTSFWKRMLGLEPGLQDLLSVVQRDVTVTSVLPLPNTTSLQRDIMALDEPAPRSDGIRVGVVYCEEDQTNENQFFSNLGTSRQFDEFLELLGDKIELLGWPHHNGGLDTQKGRSGTHSVYTRWKEDEIMFHVSTLLPLYEKDPQQLERKKHIGNDRVVIIFKDGDKPHPPDSIASKTTQIMILVQVCEASGMPIEDGNNDTTHYRVSIARKKTVPWFEPALPDPPIFRKDNAFREFLFTKVLSGLGATHYSKEFSALRKLYTESSLKKFASAHEPGHGADSASV